MKLIMEVLVLCFTFVSLVTSSVVFKHENCTDEALKKLLVEISSGKYDGIKNVFHTEYEMDITNIPDINALFRSKKTNPVDRFLDNIRLTIIKQTFIRSLFNLNSCEIYAANQSDIKVFFHNKNTDESGVLIDLNKLDALKQLNFNNNNDSVFLIHGWSDDYTGRMIKDLTNAYLNVTDVNVFAIDWSKIASKTYIEAFANVHKLGQIIGEFITSLIKEVDLKLNKTIIIGHSLGAHIAGVAAAQVNSEAELLIGLDPAGPLFNINILDNRIDASDAKFVQIVHTNAGILGWKEKLGNSDYWPNGGSHQPGCEDDTWGHCAHARTYMYFAESLLTGKFNAKRCVDWETYVKGGCDKGELSWIGQINIDLLASGNYYLRTNAQSPFAQG